MDEDLRGMAFVPAHASLSPRPTPPAQRCTRRSVLSFAAAAASAMLVPPDLLRAAGLTSSGRLERCKGDEACISTSSVGNPVKFAPPWTYESQTNDAAAAWLALKEAVLQNKDGGKIVESRDGRSDFYLRAEFPSFANGTE
jgi:hypothetical protein